MRASCSSSCTPATLLVAVWTSNAQTRVREVAAILAFVAVAAGAITVMLPGDATAVLRVILLLLVAGLPLVLTRGVAHAVRTNGVTLNAVSGVLTIYLLLALLFAVLYMVCNDLGDAAFFAGKPKDVDPGDFVYFAITTQTTVGFGDFVPGTVGRARVRGGAGGHRADVPRDRRRGRDLEPRPHAAPPATAGVAGDGA